MALIYLLDTNMVTYIVRGRSEAAERKLLGLDPDEAACISVVTEAEIRYGLAKVPAATELKRLMEAFLASIHILPWGRDEARAYGDLRADLEAAGLTLGSMDLMIAAHAVATNATVVTNDEAFSRVPKISRTVNWATDL